MISDLSNNSPASSISHSTAESRIQQHLGRCPTCTRSKAPQNGCLSYHLQWSGILKVNWALVVQLGGVTRSPNILTCSQHPPIASS